MANVRRLLGSLYGWAAERLYREFAWAYEAVAWLVSLGQWDAWRRQVLSHIVGERVLELGFGTGALLVEAARRGIGIYGVEPSRSMQRVSARLLRRNRLSVPRVRAVAQALPFHDGVFDTILVTFPTNYVLDARTLQEGARVLRDRGADGGGRLVITGVGFRTVDSLLRKAEQLVRGGHAEGLVDWYAQARAVGFKVTMVAEERNRGLCVPVFIFEKREVEPGR